MVLHDLLKIYIYIYIYIFENQLIKDMVLHDRMLKYGCLIVGLT